MKHVHHLSTEKESKKTYNIPKCIPIDTHQLNPTKIIDGCQVLRVGINRYKQLIPKCSYAKWLNSERGSRILHATLCQRSLTKVAAPYLF